MGGWGARLLFEKTWEEYIEVMKGFPYYCVAISSTLSSSRSHDRDLPALLNVNANSHKKTLVRMKEAKLWRLFNPVPCPSFWTISQRRESMMWYADSRQYWEICVPTVATLLKKWGETLLCNAPMTRFEAPQSTPLWWKPVWNAIAFRCTVVDVNNSMWNVLEAFAHPKCASLMTEYMAVRTYSVKSYAQNTLDT